MLLLKEFVKSFRIRHNFVVFLLLTVIFTILYIAEESYLSSFRNNSSRETDDTDLIFEEESFSFLQLKTEGPFNGHKLIHFDLKGAPPKVSYILDLIPLMKRLGATGLLLEYEDMFPYHDEIQDIKAHNAYTSLNITTIVETAESHNLTVIPLVQTFGHLEFVLKLEQYKDLREVTKNPQVLCPSRKRAYSIVQKMIDQVMKKHPKAKYLHIGCDEVYQIGLCSKCQGLMRKKKWRKDNIYFKHVKKIAEYIVKNYPEVKPIIWGDRFLKQNEKVILSHGLGDLVEVMLWNYNYQMNTFPKVEDMKSYARLFKNIWMAGAFKGASGNTRMIPNPEFHLRNIAGWMQIVKKWNHKINFKGIALTGWQRFHHFAMLCELLPVAIPSMALSLQFLVKENDLKNDELKQSLQCNDLVPVNVQEARNTALMTRLKCGFPGFNAYQIIHRFHNKLLNYKKLLNNLLSGDFSFYNIFYNFTNPILISNFHDNGFENHLSQLNELEKNIRIALAEIYDNHTINEWIIMHITPLQMRLKAAINVINNLFDMDAWPQRPLKNDPLLIRRNFEEVCSPVKKTGCPFYIVYGN